MSKNIVGSSNLEFCWCVLREGNRRFGRDPSLTRTCQSAGKGRTCPYLLKAVHYLRNSWDKGSYLYDYIVDIQGEGIDIMRGRTCKMRRTSGSSREGHDFSRVKDILVDM